MEVARLAMGDAVVSREKGGLPDGPTLIVERKILTDPVASVIDGRLAEQHQRMEAYRRSAVRTGAIPTRPR